MTTEVSDLVLVDERESDYNAFHRLITTRQTLSKIIHVSNPSEAAVLRRTTARIDELLSQLPDYEMFVKRYLGVKEYDAAA